MPVLDNVFQRMPALQEVGSHTIVNGPITATIDGAVHGLRLFGPHAAESMRLEKRHRHGKADLVIEFTPFDSNLARFVKLDKPAFVGTAALAASPSRRTLLLLVLDCTQAPAQGGDSSLSGGRVVGAVTSADWGHRVGKNSALGFVEPDVSRAATIPSRPPAAPGAASDRVQPPSASRNFPGLRVRDAFAALTRVQEGVPDQPPMLRRVMTDWKAGPFQAAPDQGAFHHGAGGLPCGIT